MKAEAGERHAAREAEARTTATAKQAKEEGIAAVDPGVEKLDSDEADGLFVCEPIKQSIIHSTNQLLHTHLPVPMSITPSPSLSHSKSWP